MHTSKESSLTLIADLGIVSTGDSMLKKCKTEVVIEDFTSTHDIQLFQRRTSCKGKLKIVKEDALKVSCEYRGSIKKSRLQKIEWEFTASVEFEMKEFVWAILFSHVLPKAGTPLSTAHDVDDYILGLSNLQFNVDLEKMQVMKVQQAE